jgi:hypothetical protein
MGTRAEPVWCSHVSIAARNGPTFLRRLSVREGAIPRRGPVGQVLRVEKPALSLQVCEIERAANRVDECLRPAGPVAVTHDEPYGHSQVCMPVLP